VLSSSESKISYFSLSIDFKVLDIISWNVSIKCFYLVSKVTIAHVQQQMLQTEITFSTRTAVQQINFQNLNVVENYFRNNKIMLSRMITYVEWFFFLISRI